MKNLAKLEALGIGALILCSLVATIWGQAPTTMAPTTYAVTTTGQLFRSTNSGQTWERIIVNADVGDFDGEAAVATDPSDPRILYLAHLETPTGKGPRPDPRRVLLVSADGGQRWSANVLPISNVGAVSLFMSVDPSNPSLLFVGGAALYRSEDSGRTWRTVLEGIDTGRGFSSRNLRKVVFDSARRGTMYVVAEDGLYRSTDSGLTWLLVTKNLGNQDASSFRVHSIAVDPRQSDVLFASYAGSCVDNPPVAEMLCGIFRSRDAGRTWQRLPINGYFFNVTADSQGTVYAIGRNNALRTTDSGETWTPVGSGLVGNGQPEELVVDPVTPSLLFARFKDYSLFSRNSGATWSSVQIPGQTGRIAGIVAGPRATETPGIAPALTAAGIANSASYAAGPIAPGEIVTLFGANLAPGTAGLRLDQGRVATENSGVRVLFDGVPAPILSLSPGQASVIVPYGVAGRATSSVAVEVSGRASLPVSVNVAVAAPALFTANASGRGPGAILNQDNTLNSATNPASLGSVVILYGTGEGQTSPAGVDGKLTVAPLPRPVLPVTATIGGVPADVLYAGGVPGQVAGLWQVNLQVPAGLTPGTHPVVVRVDGVASQDGVTVAVR